MGAIIEPFLYIIGLLVDIYFKIVVVQVVLFWLIHFKILEPSNKYAQKTVNQFTLGPLLPIGSKKLSMSTVMTKLLPRSKR